MNRCEEVLKHSINKGLKIETDELYHSDTYLGSEYDEGLKHWKYIKKYKNSRGKTVYVYANKDSHENLNRLDNHISNLRSESLKESYKARKNERGYNRPADSVERRNHNREKEYLRDLAKDNTKTYDRLLDENQPTKVIKRDAKKAIKKVKDLSYKALDRGFAFIEHILGRNII